VSPTVVASAAAAAAVNVQGTAWNIVYTSGAPIRTPRFNVDGDPGSFSNAERRLIIAMWRAVAEYFAIWEVDVTTEDPGPAALERWGGEVTVT
jgi:hypothetical protein